MVKIAEATLSEAMQYTFDNFVKPLDKRELLGYMPISQNDTAWLRDNKTTGVIFLKDYPSLKESWILVKFEQRTDSTYGKHTIAGNRVKITNLSEFQDFFGVLPGPNFDFTSDMTVTVTWDKQSIRNKYPNTNFDETTPNFYMYVSHRKVTIDKLVNKLYKIYDYIQEQPDKAIIGNQFNVPISLIDIK